MMHYELVIFDWDGTLMDSVGKIVACMQQTARVLELPVPLEMAVRDIIGLSMGEALSILHPDGDDSVYSLMKDMYRQQYLELNDTPSPLFEGAESLVQQLNVSGYQLAVATGKARAGLNRVLNETGLGVHFVASRCADEAMSKPNPGMILQLLAELNVAPDKAVMIGDSVHDLNMANNAGIDAIGVSYGAHDADKLRSANPKAIINSPLELLSYLGH
ncbi:HAD-IIIA family hydrolase [Shewanella sp. D64]|uniref:HAD family hydrolase n=1 Tax=unclassified Shewanella TaxID=196818 RepID=UPI0022BA40E2|nr:MULTISPECIES: HAD-IIIA family hydrolase [unclassified Shewanella]MEC4724868.1 HAD-IIIA family hydrolase [Shewanella sp. D64]MEC4736339.1 HAD-IIIA family hydrolase [Shewanella sp. E94]WBJ97600.1 HAD-IIIA family hydrolase [Shewanella sp. MTB7]